MLVERPDPDFQSPERAARNLLLAVKLTAGFLALIWLVFAVDQTFGLQLRRFALYPREISGLSGIVTVPMLHANLAHIAHNSVPLLVGGTALLYLYPNSALRVLPVLYGGTSLLAWFFARPNIHLGASGLVYAMLTYVFIGGLLRRDLRSITVSLLLWFLYGSMIWGLFPIREGMSWELHLSGAVIGFLMAWWYRHWDRVPIKRYDWEDDDEVPDWFPEDQAIDPEDESR